MRVLGPESSENRRIRAGTENALMVTRAIVPSWPKSRNEERFA